jgi:hypothetical protein
MWRGIYVRARASSVVQTVCRERAMEDRGSVTPTALGEQSRAASNGNVLKRLVNAMSSAPFRAEKAITYCCCLC